MSGSEVKLLVMGAGGVGKSCITVRYTSDQFLEKYNPTIEDQFSTTMTVDDKAIQVSILDTAGQECYTSLRENFIQTGDGFVFVYSITEDSSLDDVKKIKEDIYSNESYNIKPDTPMILVGNKSDLESERSVLEEEGKRLAEEWNCDFVESSALSNSNIEVIFEKVVRKVLEKDSDKGKVGSGVLGAGSTKKKQKKSIKCSLL